MALRRENWQGQNLLGKILTEVRDELLKTFKTRFNATQNGGDTAIHCPNQMENIGENIVTGVTGDQADLTADLTDTIYNNDDTLVTKIKKDDNTNKVDIPVNSQLIDIASGVLNQNKPINDSGFQERKSMRAWKGNE